MKRRRNFGGGVWRKGKGRESGRGEGEGGGRGGGRGDRS